MSDRVRRKHRSGAPLSKSEQMSRVRTRNTAPELLLRRALWTRGLRYRVHPPLPGKPDFAFPGVHVAVFVDGCFWHGCPVHGSAPKTNAHFWQRKLARNAERDRAVEVELERRGWTVVRVWEHSVESALTDTAEYIERLVAERRAGAG